MEIIGFLLLLISVNTFAVKLGIAKAYKNNKAIKGLMINALVFIVGGLIVFLYAQ